MRSDYLSPELAAQLRRKLTPSNRLVLDVCGATGLRIGDVVALPTDAVLHAVRHRGWMPVTEQKTGKRRSVRVPGDLLARLVRHSGARWAFPNQRDENRHRDRTTAWRQLKTAAGGGSLNITPHSYRKMYAVGLYRACGDLDKVRRTMGHGRVETTLLYATADAITAAKLARMKNRAGNRRRV